MMRYSKRPSPGFTTVVVCLSILSVQFCTAAYISRECDALPAIYQETNESPTFLSDYSLASETLFVNPKNSLAYSINEKQVQFSETLKQAYVDTVTNVSHTVAFVDATKNECFYDNFNGTCTIKGDTCTKVANDLNFIEYNAKKVAIGSTADSFGWKLSQMKKLLKGNSTYVRNIKCDQYAMCLYNEENDETTTSHFFVMIPGEFRNADPSYRLILSAYHLVRSTNRKGIYRFGYRIADRTIDYFAQRKLEKNELDSFPRIPQNSKCTHIQGEMSDVSFPEIPMHFSFKSMTIAQGTNQPAGKHISIRKEEIFEEFDYSEKISRLIKSIPVEDELTESDSINTLRVESVGDWSDNKLYRLSLATGTCTVTPNFSDDTQQTMETPKQYWGLVDIAKVDFLTTAIVRDIPTNVWSVYYPDLGDYTWLYLATSEWLDSQGHGRDMFFPVYRETHTKDGQILSEFYYEYQENPLYYIPNLQACYEPEDMVHIRLTIMRNFDKYVVHNQVAFEQESRTWIKAITGIITSLRIANIQSYESNQSPDQTVVDFTIFGKYVNCNSTEADCSDFVTSLDATQRIVEAVQQGVYTYTSMVGKSTIIFKRNSFKELTSLEMELSRQNKRPHDVDVLNGYSSGVMAAVALSLFIVCFTLALGGVFIFKRWRKGPLSNVSVKMNSLQNEDEPRF